MRTCVIIPAAGASTRYGGLRSKLDEDMAGRPVLQRTVELFVKRDDVGAIVVAGPHDEAAFKEFKDRHGDKLGLLGVTLCRGGKTHRYETVAAALPMVPADCTHVAVHDAARPCAPAELIERVFLAAEKRAAVAPAIEVSDTLKRVGAEPMEDHDVDPLAAILGGAGASSGRPKLWKVEATVPRERLWAVQTPQVFRADVLKRAYAQKDLSSTDDCGLVERLGEEVVLVEGDVRNIKITRQGDLKLAMAILGLKADAGRPAHLKF